MSVVVVHNQSDEGRSALTAGVREAQSRGTELVVIHALSGSPEPRAQAQEVAAVETAVHALAPGARVEVGAPDPDSTSTLLALVDKVDAELVVIGSRHRSAVGKFLMGQTVQRLLLEIPVEILLVKSR
ncbi:MULTISPECIES: universal stress protein [Nocardiaceae]|jgi:nucleotide-binding universal stress UspA family protein|uniref:universal stress protein n=1 Tax=Nocardiaceae TaxID=85025 RepID=UPI00056031FD|nr:MULTISPECIES: universal stress protein [Rhodococcus]OZF04713.1 universal stress protein [Rhodococcus sp. 15-1189-1-1a]OZF18977.1 universal stress protein [Rhodococcus sp. 14-2686-1-2]OZF55696.1 universal stress protein [Rhodococcus sp. 14-2470-1b]